MKIWHVPIEPVYDRYSALWNRWFRERWPTDGWVEGREMTGSEGFINVGDFLDVRATHYYKASQVMKLAEMLAASEIGEGDVLFFHDLWFPLEQVFYMLDATDHPAKVAGFAHCGSYSRHDLLQRQGMGEWARHVERGWLSRVDRVLVFSEFHRDLLAVHRLCYKARVVPFPYATDEIEAGWEHEARGDVVLWPHRDGPDKGDYDEAARVFAEQGLELARFFGARADYLRELQSAKYVLCWPRSETFGIVALEAWAAGASVIVPDRYSYKTWWPDRFRTLRGAAEFVREDGEMLNQTGPRFVGEEKGASWPTWSFRAVRDELLSL